MHQIKQHLSQVKGNTPERIALRRRIKPLRKLQAKHNASLWKQYNRYVEAGNNAKARQFAGHLDKFSKLYGLPNPLK